MGFVPLAVKSMYSLLEAPVRPAELVAVAKERGYQAVGLVDARVLYGAVNFVRRANQAGLHPVIGVSLPLTFAEGTLDVTLLVKGAVGYQNLTRLSTRAMTDRANQPLTIEDLREVSDDLVVIVAPQLMLLGVSEQTYAQLGEVADYLGINLDFTAAERQDLQAVAERCGLPLIAFEPVEYLNEDDYFATQVLRAIKAGHTIEDPLKASQRTGRHWLRPAEEVAAAYRAAGLAEAAAQTVAVAERCQVHFADQTPVLPAFPTPAGQGVADYLRELCQRGLAKRKLAGDPAEYQARLEHELTVIHQMGFDNYFLIVWDLMNFAHQHQILTGPGRGSAAGSLVAYALAITDVDPLQYGLLFERFLNPERAQMPDIDLDLPDNRREEVLNYLHHHYGHERVAQIITFGSLGTKQVLRDVSRVFNLPKYQVDSLSQVIDRVKGPHQTLADLLESAQPVQNLARDSKLVACLLEVAAKLEGLPRHDSIHAAGVVLAAEPLIKTVPLQAGNEPGAMLVTQFEKDTVESLGLLKIDLLGLRNLTTVETTLNLIHQHQPDFDLTHIALNDRPTLALFDRGQTSGIFQFESSGIRQTLVNLHPDNFEEIVAVNALYRPGPMDNINHFIARKKGQEAVNLPAKELAPILAPTYGILVYQEQVMQVAAVMGGFSLGEADLLRRAMSKKKLATMASMKEAFLAGANKRGYPNAVAEQVFAYIDQFANYGFNRSHAVAYSKMAFEMAYLKVHFPAEFLAALMETDPDTSKVWAYFSEAKQLGITTHGPAINQSQERVSLVDQELWLGLDMIKGLRRDFIRAIIEERNQHGPYQDLPDLVNRLDAKWHKEALFVPLIDAGALDHLGYNRAEMAEGLKAILEGAEYAGLGLGMAPVVAQRNEYPLAVRLAREHAVLGTYLSGHPVSQYQDLRTKLKLPTVAQLRPNQRVRLVLMVTRMRKVTTKREHKPMAFLTASDETGAVEVTIFNRLFTQLEGELRVNGIYLITAKTEQREGQVQLLADQVTDAQVVNRELHPADHRWVLRLPSGVAQTTVTDGIKALAKEHAGNVPVVIYDPVTQKATQLPGQLWLAKQRVVQEGLINLVGRSNLAFQALS